MEHLKLFEDYSEHISNKDLFKQLFDENPNKDTHDLYVFLSTDEFIKLPDDNYKKVLGIEKMNRITPDKQGMNAIAGMDMRAKFQSNIKMYGIWMPKDVRDMVDNKGYQEIEDWLLKTIGEHSFDVRAARANHTQIQNIIDRAKDIGKYNL